MDQDIDGLRKQIIANATLLFPHCNDPKWMSAPDDYMVLVTHNRLHAQNPYTARLLITQWPRYAHNQELAKGGPSSSATGSLQNLLLVTAGALDEAASGRPQDVQDGEHAKAVAGGWLDGKAILRPCSSEALS